VSRTVWLRRKSGLNENVRSHPCRLSAQAGIFALQSCRAKKIGALLKRCLPWGGEVAARRLGRGRFVTGSSEKICPAV